MDRFGDVLKTPVLIRKPKFLLPVNPENFYIQSFSDIYANNISGIMLKDFIKDFLKLVMNQILESLLKMKTIGLVFLEIYG